MKHKNKFVHYGLSGLIYGVASLTLVYHIVFHNMTHAQTLSRCATNGRTVQLSVGDNTMSPTHISASRCDVLELVNNGNKTHLMAIGEHEHHSHYGSFEEGLLNPGQTISVSLALTGKYTLHDHLNDDLRTNIDIR